MRNSAETSAVPVMTPETARQLLGLQTSVPLTTEGMARSLRVTFFPHGTMTPRVAAFAAQLQAAFEACGVTIVPWADAIAGGRRGKVQEGIVIIAPGTLEEGKLPVDFVPNLRGNTVVGIEDGPCPADAKTDQQEKLNAIVATLVWNIVQVVIYVDPERWTICTMNGAIIPCRYEPGIRDEVYRTLVPKLAAPVVPPHASDFLVEEGGLDLRALEWRPYVQDFERSAPLWEETGLMLFHTALNAVTFRNMYYRRVASAYLDKRSGMSYGFLSRQPALALLPAQKEEPGQEGTPPEGCVRLHVGSSAYIVRIPDVAVLATRSGCDKSHIDGYRDLVLLGLQQGKIILKTPKGLDPGIDARPSYDTLTILAHAIGNALIGSLMALLRPDARFLTGLGEQGIALAHWHGGLERNVIPRGYVVFGEDNPPVSCSTHQAALYTLMGKLNAFGACIREGREFLGDVHVEPHHGINVTWSSLTALAAAILAGSQAREAGRERAQA